VTGRAGAGAAQVRSARPSAGDLALMAVGVLGVSTSGPLIAAMAAPALAIAFWRNAMSLAVIGPMALARHLGELRSLPRRAWLLSLGSGALLAAHFAFWVPSLQFTSVASSTALVCMQAVWAAVFARLAGWQIGRRAWAGMALALVGVLAVTGVDVTLEPRALLGDGLALVGGVFSGAYVVVGGEVRRHVSTTAYTAICYGVCAALLLVVCLATGQALGGYAGADWARLVALTVAAQLLGHSVFNLVLRRVSPAVVSLTILLEVPGAALIAAVFLGQVPPPAAVPAVALILVGIGIVISARPEGEPAVVPAE
jgi:drug/metabolite transporter (DMT)-like permease